MWELIDWKGKAEIKRDTLIQDCAVESYFKEIFQSRKTKDHPKIPDISNKLDEYKMHVPILDDTPHTAELNVAVKKIGKGCGLDGIPADIVRLLPQSTFDAILTLLQNTFTGSYQSEWEKQLLNALPKDDHTINTPKLRGIAIAPTLARLYDCILDARFQKWYTPNREHAGFRPEQGCLFQIFILDLSIHHAKEKKVEPHNRLYGF